VPDSGLVEQLVQRTVRLSLKRVCAYFQNHVEPPPGWKRQALLRHLRPAVFDDQGILAGSDFTLRLDDDLGLVVDDTNKGEDTE